MPSAIMALARNDHLGRGGPLHVTGHEAQVRAGKGVIRAVVHGGPGIQIGGLARLGHGHVVVRTPGQAAHEIAQGHVLAPGHGAARGQGQGRLGVEPLGHLGQKQGLVRAHVDLFAHGEDGPVRVGQQLGLAQDTRIGVRRIRQDHGQFLADVGVQEIARGDGLVGILDVLHGHVGAVARMDDASTVVGISVKTTAAAPSGRVTTRIRSPGPGRNCTRRAPIRRPEPRREGQGEKALQRAAGRRGKNGRFIGPPGLSRVCAGTKYQCLAYKIHGPEHFAKI